MGGSSASSARELAHAGRSHGPRPRDRPPEGQRIKAFDAVPWPFVRTAVPIQLLASAQRVRSTENKVRGPPPGEPVAGHREAGEAFHTIAVQC
jgi:hypothetical protein